MVVVEDVHGNIKYTYKMKAGVCKIEGAVNVLKQLDYPLEIINDVNSDNLFIQYDIYHAQRMEGELVNTLEKNLSKIGHLQIADNPGRNEPGTGEINYINLFKMIDKMGYVGWIGCEYKPLNKTELGLPWIQDLQSSTSKL